MFRTARKHGAGHLLCGMAARLAFVCGAITASWWFGATAGWAVEKPNPTSTITLVAEQPVASAALGVDAAGREFHRRSESASWFGQQDEHGHPKQTATSDGHGPQASAEQSATEQGRLPSGQAAVEARLPTSLPVNERFPGEGGLAAPDRVVEHTSAEDSNVEELPVAQTTAEQPVIEHGLTEQAFAAQTTLAATPAQQHSAHEHSVRPDSGGDQPAEQPPHQVESEPLRAAAPQPSPSPTDAHSSSAASSLPQRIIREAPSRVTELGDQALLRVDTVIGALRNALPAFADQAHPVLLRSPEVPAEDPVAGNPDPSLTDVGILPVLDSGWALVEDSILPVLPSESPTVAPRPDSDPQVRLPPLADRDTHVQRPTIVDPADFETSGSEPTGSTHFAVGGPTALVAPEIHNDVPGQQDKADQHVPQRSWPESPVVSSASAMASSSTGLDHAPQRGLSGVLTALAALPEPTLWGSLEAEDVSATSDLSRRPAPTPD